MSRPSRGPKVPDVVMLSQVADLLTRHFGLNYPIAYMTPYDWWKRRDTIKPFFPAPVTQLGVSPLFRAQDVIEWYAKYKGWDPKRTWQAGAKAEKEKAEKKKSG